MSLSATTELCSRFGPALFREFTGGHWIRRSEERGKKTNKVEVLTRIYKKDRRAESRTLFAAKSEEGGNSSVNQLRGEKKALSCTGWPLRLQPKTISTSRPRSREKGADRGRERTTMKRTARGRRRRGRGFVCDALCTTGHPAGDGHVVSQPTRPFFSSAEPATAWGRKGRTRGSETTRPPLQDLASDAPHVDGEEQESALYPPPSPGASGPAPSARPAIPRGTVTSSLSLRVRSSRQLSRRRHGDGKDGPVVLRRRVPRSRIRTLTRRTSTERSRKPTRPFFSSAEPATAWGRKGRTRGSETTRPPLQDSASDAPHVNGEEQESALYPPPSPGASGPAPSA
ncbi:Hypothetical predicted protein [Xyrichtys novacula]|uniref:Uncharacterized protein n=1 Tax=Xyrichtys novacula TaxID=13765 RepID=A0AAV1HAN0_XYRNO|nr:Hypothetical predicted protein [Xyrichtys novacula]